MLNNKGSNLSSVSPILDEGRAIRKLCWPEEYRIVLDKKIDKYLLTDGYTESFYNFCENDMEYSNWVESFNVLSFYQSLFILHNGGTVRRRSWHIDRILRLVIEEGKQVLRIFDIYGNKLDTQLIDLDKSAEDWVVVDFNPGYGYMITV